jgi:putative MATE family efflux protein
MHHTKELENAPIGRLLIKLSIPAIAGTVITSLYNITDRIFLGRFVGEHGIAATTVAFPLMLIMMAFGMLIAFGTNSQISIKLGEKKHEEAEKLLGQGILLFLIFSVVFTAGSLFFLKDLLRFFGASPSIMPYATEYLSIVLIGTLPHEISFGVNSFIRGEGNSKAAMYTMIIGGVLNIILDYLFIVRFGWGMKGAAWATVLGYSISALWVLQYYWSGKSTVKLKLSNLKYKWHSVRTVLKMGSPHFIMNILSSLQFSLFNNQLGKFGGDQAISVMGVIMSFNMLWLMPIIGMSQGLQPIAGYNHGAGKPERVKSSLLMAIGFATIFCLGFYAFVYTYPELIFSAFVKDGAKDFLAMGSNAIKNFLLVLPIVGYLIIGGNYFQFIGRPKVSLTLTIFRQVVCLIPAILFLPQIWDLNGIWRAMPASDIGALAMTSFFFFRELKRLNSEILKKNSPHNIKQN